MTTHLRGIIKGIALDNMLDTDMDGNYASWHDPAPPIEIGCHNDVWNRIVALLDHDPAVVTAIRKYYE
jgi:hypothetical protein